MDWFGEYLSKSQDCDICGISIARVFTYAPDFLDGHHPIEFRCHRSCFRGQGSQSSMQIFAYG